MALLKFKCSDCSEIFEELTSSDKKPPCPKCGSQKTQRYYQGKCYAGKHTGGCSSGSCSSCKGCGG